KPGIIRFQQVRAMFRDVSGTATLERIVVDAMTMHIEREKCIAVLVRPVVTQIDQRSAMSVPAASGVILRMFCALGFPEAARPMNVISAAFDQTERIAIVILAVHTFVARARDDMEKLLDNAIGDKHLAMLGERNAPRMGC